MEPSAFAIPAGAALELELSPRLESWERRDDPAQVALREWVAHVRERIDPLTATTEGQLAFRLDVGLPDDVDALWERDLDNYLFPIARELPQRFVSIWGTKARRPNSYVTVQPAVAGSPPDWQSYSVSRAPGGEKTWKHAVRAAVSHARQLPPGPVGMQIALAVGAGRSWTNIWKRTIDGLEPLLGRTYPNRDWNPQDGRIVRLGLHVAVDPELKHDVEATIWATSGDLDWPELRWLKDMSETARREYIAAHQAILDRAAAGSARTTPVVPVARRTGGRRRSALPHGVVELKTAAEFEQAVAGGALIVNTDIAGPPKLHLKPKQCDGVSVQNFERKVILGGGKNGRYYTIIDPGIGHQRWPRLGVCGTCSRLDPVLAAEVESLLTDPVSGDMRPGSD